MAEGDKGLIAPDYKLRDWMVDEGLSSGYARDSAEMVSEFFENYLLPAGCKSLGISTKNLGARNFRLDLIALQPKLSLKESDSLINRLGNACFGELQRFHTRDESFEPEVDITLFFIKQADLLTSFERDLASKSKRHDQIFLGILRERSMV